MSLLPRQLTTLQSEPATGPSTVNGAAHVVHDSRESAELLVHLNATRNGVAGTLDVTIQDSFDDGATWQTVDTFTQLTATGQATRKPTRSLGPLVRAVAVIAGAGTTYTWVVKLFGETNISKQVLA